jgi:hypothetical protein
MTTYPSSLVPDAQINPPDEPAPCGSDCDRCDVPLGKCPGPFSEFVGPHAPGIDLTAFVRHVDIDTPQGLGWRDYLLLVYPQ